MASIQLKIKRFFCKTHEKFKFLKSIIRDKLNSRYQVLKEQLN